MIVFFIFVLGLFIGSFLNVIIYRLHRGEGFVSGFSKCLFCQHRLFAKDLVPLFSFLYLRGRCRYCKQKFSWQYPLVELATGLVFVLVFLNIAPYIDIFGLGLANWYRVIFWWLLSAFLIVTFVYDLRYYLILDQVMIPAAIVALVGNLFLGFDLVSMLWGALAGGGFFLFQFVISKGKWIGGGDIRLGVLMGLILAWPNVLSALFIAYLLGSAVSVVLLLKSRRNWGDKVPFGTFLSLATIITMLYGDKLVAWYWGLF